MAGGRCRLLGMADCASLHWGGFSIRNGASQQVNFECGYIVRDSPV